MAGAEQQSTDLRWRALRVAGAPQQQFHGRLPGDQASFYPLPPSLLQNLCDPKSNRPSVGSTGTALTIAKDGAELAMATPISITTTDLVFNAIELEQAARAELLEASRMLDRAKERLAQKGRQLLATTPETKAGAAELLGYLASVIEPHEEIAGLALPALAGIRQVLVQYPTRVQGKRLVLSCVHSSQPP